uniref:Uncharacterized protein n=1 Tax=Amphimedon queenslandica TaxID=400682 RepID=A0A1X7UJY6_AMPQE
DRYFIIASNSRRDHAAHIPSFTRTSPHPS